MRFFRAKRAGEVQCLGDAPLKQTVGRLQYEPG